MQKLKFKDSYTHTYVHMYQEPITHTVQKITWWSELCMLLQW